MIVVQGRGRLRHKRPSIAPHDSSSPLESEIFEQPDGPLGPKSFAATNISKYSEDDLQRILKAVLEAWAPVPAPVPAFVISEVPRKKLKARYPNVYRGKSHMDYYNFCQ